MTDEHEKMFHANLGLVYSIFERYQDRLLHNPHEYDRDDMLQWGMIGLIKSVEGFDPDRGNRFSSFATKTIWGYMMVGHRRVFNRLYNAKVGGRPAPSVFSIFVNPTFVSHEGNYGAPSMMHEAVTDHGSAAKAMEDLVLPSLVVEKVRRTIQTPRRREIFDAVVAEPEFNMAKVAEDLGCTRQNIEQSFNGTIRRARTLLDQEELHDAME